MLEAVLFDFDGTLYYAVNTMEELAALFDNLLKENSPGGLP